MLLKLAHCHMLFIMPFSKQIPETVRVSGCLLLAFLSHSTGWCRLTHGVLLVLKAKVKRNYIVKKRSKEASEAAVAAVSAALTWRDQMKQADKQLINNDNDAVEHVSPNTLKKRERHRKFQELVLADQCLSLIHI